MAIATFLDPFHQQLKAKNVSYSYNGVVVFLLQSSYVYCSLNHDHISMSE